MTAWLRPVDTASLGVVRVGIGVLISIKALRRLLGGGVARHLDPAQWRVPWPGLEWLSPPELWVSVLVQLVLVLAGIFVALGLGARLWLVVAAAELAWFQALDQTVYLNHHVLAAVVCLTLAASPCDRVAALDQRWRRQPVRAPAAGLWMLRITVVLVYVHAGLAKLDPDWLAGRPLQDWMATRAHLPLVGPLLATPPTGQLMAWAGLLLDLVGGLALLFRRTRGPAVALLGLFHLTNAALFQIGIFPWMMLLLDLLFFDPDWPRQLLSLRRDARPVPPAPSWWRWPLGAWVAVQILVPLRHLAYPGPASWTEEGHRFAWRMMLRSKVGPLQLRVIDLQSGEQELVDGLSLVTPAQRPGLVGHPDAVWTLARRLRQEAEAEGRTVAVYVHHPVSLNGREPALLVDPSVDLSRAPRHVWTTAPWIRPHPDTAPALLDDPAD